MKRIITVVILIMALLPQGYAQNKIDKMVEHFSTVGNCKFTSAVVRDPATRQIQKVIKVLETSSPNANKFLDVFRDEAKKGNYHESRDNNELTITLDSEGNSSHRIYMLNARTAGKNNYYRNDRYDAYCEWAKVTIIIKVLR